MDLIIDRIFNEEMEGDTSFRENRNALSLIFGSHKFSQREMRETWNSGIKHGIEIGLRRASLEGQKIELKQNTPDGKQREFLEKFYKLANEYKCAIKYHPKFGMVIINTDQT